MTSCHLKRSSRECWPVKTTPPCRGAKYEAFIDLLVDRCCSSKERHDYFEAAARTQTGGIQVESNDGNAEIQKIRRRTGKRASGDRRHASRPAGEGDASVHTPFFQEILVCGEVIGEGVDLQRFCRHVIQHDLAWNPSTIEQRTGRIDRLGCKAENRHPIEVFLPYLAGAADERQYRVMTEREHWFGIVMGQEEVAKLIPSMQIASSCRHRRPSRKGSHSISR